MCDHSNLLRCSPPLASDLAVLMSALSSEAGAKAKDKWGIFKSIDDSRPEPGPGVVAGWGARGGPGECVRAEDFKDEIALLKGKLASAKRCEFAGARRRRRSASA